MNTFSLKVRLRLLLRSAGSLLNSEHVLYEYSEHSDVIQARAGAFAILLRNNLLYNSLKACNSFSAQRVFF